MESRDVIYYGRPIPETVFLGHGVRGWFVLLLNYVRWKIQRWTEYHAMIILAKKSGIHDKDMLSAFKLRWSEENVEAGQHRRRTLAALAAIDPDVAKHRYASRAYKWADPAPEEKKPKDSLVHTMSKHVLPTREKRYAGGRDKTEVYEVETEEEPTAATG